MTTNCLGAGALLAVLLTATPALGHGFGQRYDLPVPLWLWVAGAASAVSLSFAVIGLFVGRAAEPISSPRVNLLRWRLGRVLIDPRVRLTGRALAIALLVVTVAAAAFGNQNPTRNLAPTLIWVVWWVGLAYASALVGDVWAVINPWQTLYALAERLYAPHGKAHLSLGLRYPEALGVWPASVLFVAFAWIELVFSGRAVPGQLALLTIIYSAITFAGMFLFGRLVWVRGGDPFAVAFGVLARFAPTEIRVTDSAICEACEIDCADPAGCVNCGSCFARAPESVRELNLRPFGVGLFTGRAVATSMVVFVLVMLSTVTFDGFIATPVWAALESRFYVMLSPLGGARFAVIGTLGLLTFPLLFVIVYGLFSLWMARASDGRFSMLTVARAFVLSLVPIAIAYHLAHYLTYLLIQGQLGVALVSDPFGFGWNLFGTAGYRPDIGIVGARFAWYSAVVAIVAGHIIAVYVAHTIALRWFENRHRALRSQYAMLVLMVGYTVASLWIIAQPIVESGAAG